MQQNNQGMEDSTTEILQLLENDKEDEEKRCQPKISLLNAVQFMSSDSDSQSDDDHINMVQEKTNHVADETEAEAVSFGIIDSNLVRKRKNLVGKSKKEKQKKAEIVALIQQLQTYVITLEKEKHSQVYRRNVKEKDKYGELEEIEKRDSFARMKEKKLAVDSLSKLGTMVQKLKGDIQRANTSHAYVERLKLSMEDIESTMMKFKEDQRNVYEDLLLEERIITTEIDSYEKKFEEWGKNVTTQEIPVSSRSASSKAMSQRSDFPMPKEVEEFEKFLKKTGGHQGGWDDYDHDVFLRLQKQNRNTRLLLAAAVVEIPTRSNEDVEQHIEWYKEYCILRDQKRKAIVKWKNMKQSEKEELLRRKEESQDEISIQKEQRKAEILERERQDRIAKMKEWKELREIEEKKLEEEKSLQEQEKIWRDAQEQRKKMELKIQVSEYKRQKEEELKLLKIVEEEKERKLRENQRISDMEKERIQERNKRLIDSRQHKLIAKDKEKKEKENRLAKLRQQVEVNVKRDPSRLYQMTEGWKHRKQDNEKVAGATVGARLMPHRSIPSWRQGLS